MDEYDRLIAARRVEMEAWLERLGAITDPLAVRLLKLHSRSGNYPVCVGCDFDGWEAEEPEWPCRTVHAIGEHFGCPAPEGLADWVTADGRPMLAEWRP